VKRPRWVSLVLCLATAVLVPCLGAEPVTAPASTPVGMPNVTKSGIVVTSVVDYGAVPNDSKDDTAAINNAINACAGSDTKTLYFPGGTFNLKSITFPAGINVSIGDGGLLEITGGDIATFNGPFTAGLYRVFSGAGGARFGAGVVKEVYPQWWYAGSEDWSPAINAAIASSPISPGITVRLTGCFSCRTTINVNRHRVALLGNGQYATYLSFNPASALPLFNFTYPGGVTTLNQCSIKDMGIGGGGTNRKIAIKIVDNDIIEVRNIAIQNWVGNNSIGLQLQGRDFGFIENITVVADLPISIEKNPYFPMIDIDHTTFRNTYLMPQDPNGPSVKIASGVHLTNVVFDGTNAWVLGKYGLYWVSTENIYCPANLSIKNVRMEQAATGGGHVIHIETNKQLQNLTLENIYSGGKNGGIYLRNCLNATLQNIFCYPEPGYKPPPAGLDIDESSSNLVLMNCWWQTGTLVKTGNLIKTFGTNTSRENEGNRLIEVYDAPKNPFGQGLVVYGTNTWCYSGKLANNAQYLLPVMGAANKVATILVAASDNSAVPPPAAPTNAGGHFIVGGGYAGPTILIAGTSNMSTTSAAGRLCLVPGNQIQLINYLGVDVDVVITVYWK